MMTITNLSKKRTILIMIGVMMSVLLSALDSTIVSTAMPKIINDLHGMEHYNWPFTAYMLCSTIVIPIAGKMADIFGRKPLYLIGAVTFIVASALCGFSQTMMQLIIFRGLQGLGGGILMSNTFAIVGDIFSPAQRGKYMGLVSAVFGLASVIGPFLGGYLTDNLSWRWVFYVNLPVGIVTIALMIVVLPFIKRDDEVKRVIDYAGTVTLILSLVPMLLAFTWAGKEYDWLSVQIIGMLVFSAMMLIVFGFVETRAAEPIIPLALFKNKVFNISVTAGFLSNAAMFGCLMFIPLFAQAVIGSNASNSGAVLTPMMLGFVFASIISGQIISRTGKMKAFGILGFMITGVGAYMLSRLNTDSTNTEIVIDMVVVGLGIGLNMPVFNIAVQNVFPHSQLGVVTSATQFFRNIGGTIASAVLGSIMLSSMQSGFKGIDMSKMKIPSGGTGGALGDILNNPQALTNADTISKVKSQIPQSLLPEFGKVMTQIKTVLSNSIHDVFVISIFVVAAALVVAIFLPEIPLRKHNAEAIKEAA